MAEPIVLDELLIVLSARPNDPEAAQAAAVRVLRRGGFVPALRRLVNELVRRYPDLRRVSVAVRR